MFKSVEEHVEAIDLRLDRLTRQMELTDKRMDRLEALWERRWEEDRKQRDEERKLREDEARKQREADRTQREEERKQREDEARKLREEERKLREDEARKLREEEQKQREADRTQREEERKQRDADRKKREEEWARYLAQSAAERRELNIHIASVSDRMGRFTDDFVAPNIPRIAKEFGLNTPVISGLGIKRRHPTNPARMREFDYLYLAEEGVIWSETKSTPRTQYLREFVASLPELVEFFPETQGKRFFPILASLRLDEAAVAYLTRHGVYALALGDDTMVILNPQVKPRVAA